MSIKNPFLKFKNNKQEERPEDKILSDKTPFVVRESYKTLRTNLTFSLPDREHRLIMVTSACMSEGKSTSCLNTAITFAETGVKVCIVDCDLRKPNIARLSGQKGTPGLSNVLAGLCKLDDAIKRGKFENLDFVLSGDIPPNPAELIESEAMTRVLEELRERYDFVFVDTPPVNVVTEASLMANKVDGVLLVINQQKTDRADVVKAVGQLEFVEAKILGVLLNDIKVEGSTKVKKNKEYYSSYGTTPQDGVKKK